MTPVVLRSPEGWLRAAVVGCVGIGFVIAAVQNSVGAAAVQLVVAAGFLVVAARMSRMRVLADERGIVDVRLFRTVLVPWTGLTGFDVNRPGGLWAGLCVRALDNEREHDLLALRAYSRSAGLNEMGELHRCAWTLEEMRQELAKQ